MKQLSKVVWEEGMYLGPHHFQAQARYFEDIIHFDVASLWFEPYGLLGWELDHQALQNGTVSLVHARGMFPDGLLFHMPESDPLPGPRNISHLFPPTSERLTVLLAVPAHRIGGANCALSQSEPPDGIRYTAEVHSLHDENTGADEKPVKLSRKNIRFLLDTEDNEGFLTLPLARVIRASSGQFAYDPGFIPPCVQISASESLMLTARRLIEILEEKAATLSKGRRSVAESAGGFSPQEVAIFWFLHAVNTSLSSVRHLYSSRRGHPEELFVELSRLAGALCTFALDSHPRSLPPYDHQNLEKCFRELDEHIRRHIETFLPTDRIRIALKPVGKYIWEGDVADQRCLDRARWILGIRSEIGEVDLITKTPQLVKVCSAQFVSELVKRAVPGLTLSHLPVPPSAVAPKVDSQYFSVNRVGPCWEHIVKTRRVGIYVPGELPGPEIELSVLLGE
jgi:type VI secretion system protein ImpJ